MAERSKIHKKSKSRKETQNKSTSDTPLDEDMQTPDADSKLPVLKNLEKTPAEIVKGGIELIAILIGLISGVIQILSVPSGKISIILVLVIVFVGIFAWRYHRDLRKLLTRESMHQLIEDVRIKTSKTGLGKFYRQPNPVSFSIAIVLLMLGLLVNYMWVVANSFVRSEIPLSAQGGNLIC